MRLRGGKILRIFGQKSSQGVRRHSRLLSHENGKPRRKSVYNINLHVNNTNMTAAAVTQMLILAVSQRFGHLFWCQHPPLINVSSWFIWLTHWNVYFAKACIAFSAKSWGGLQSSKDILCKGIHSSADHKHPNWTHLERSCKNIPLPYLPLIILLKTKQTGHVFVYKRILKCEKMVYS